MEYAYAGLTLALFRQVDRVLHRARTYRQTKAGMNLADRNLELDKARALKVQIAQAETRLDAMDDEEGALKDDLEDAQRRV